MVLPTKPNLLPNEQVYTTDKSSVFDLDDILMYCIKLSRKITIMFLFPIA